MSKKGPEFAREFLDAEMLLDTYLVAFTGAGVGGFGDTITVLMEIVSDITDQAGVSEITNFDRPKASGSGTAWSVGTLTGITRAQNDNPIVFGDNETGSSIIISCIAMVKGGNPESTDPSVSSDNSQIKWFVNLAGPGFEVFTTRTPQVPASIDLLTGMIIQEA